MFQDRRAFRISGFLVLFLWLGFVAADVWLLVQGIQSVDDNGPATLLAYAAVGAVLAALVAPGFVAVQPNEARVLVFLGNYLGTLRQAGFHWVNPFAAKRHVSLRVRNFNSERLKVNDANGNPIEIGAVVVWSVVDAARAVLEVEAYEPFVAIQAESALRALAGHYPYDAHDEQVTSLRGSPDEVATRLREELDAKLELAGVHVHDARITHLAYAPEIAQAMLRRQQAQAVIAARRQIVEGAVTMVQMALDRLAEENVVQLDEERKASMVSNLMMVLVSDHDTQPVINAGSLY
jgi:regulator of protease activity HflC (stomatin/prohibitin superfamily)